MDDKLDVVDNIVTYTLLQNQRLLSSLLPMKQI